MTVLCKIIYSISNIYQNYLLYIVLLYTTDKVQVGALAINRYLLSVRKSVQNGLLEIEA